MAYMITINSVQRNLSKQTTDIVATLFDENDAERKVAKEFSLNFGPDTKLDDSINEIVRLVKESIQVLDKVDAAEGYMKEFAGQTFSLDDLPSILEKLSKQ